LAKKTYFVGALSCLTALALAMPVFAVEAFATRNVNIRSGPGINFEIVDQLIKDEPVDKRNCNADNSWCYISHDGPGGWVAAVFLADSLTPEPPPVQTPVAPQTGRNYFAVSQVNVRTGPSTEFAIVDRLEAQETVTRGQCTSDGKWCYIDHDGANGWVSNNFLSPITPAGGQNNGAGTDAISYIARSPVNVRSGPGLNFSIVDRLDQNERVTRHQCLPDGTWCYVTHPGANGWVSANFIYQEGISQSPPDNGGGGTPPVTAPTRHGVVITGMPVRNAPTLFTGTAGRIERGSTVVIDRCTQDGYWCLIQHANVQGWVPAAFLQITEPAPAPEPVPEPADNSAVTTERVFLRDGPGLNFGVIGTVNTGRTVDVERCNPEGTWCRVTTNSRRGWVVAQYLRVPQIQTPQQTTPPPAQAANPNSICFEGFGGLRVCLE